MSPQSVYVHACVCVLSITMLWIYSMIWITYLAQHFFFFRSYLFIHFGFQAKADIHRFISFHFISVFNHQNSSVRDLRTWSMSLRMIRRTHANTNNSDQPAIGCSLASFHTYIYRISKKLFSIVVGTLIYGINICVVWNTRIATSNISGVFVVVMVPELVSVFVPLTCACVYVSQSELVLDRQFPKYLWRLFYICNVISFLFFVYLFLFGASSLFHWLIIRTDLSLAPSQFSLFFFILLFFGWFLLIMVS